MARLASKMKSLARDSDDEPDFIQSSSSRIAVRAQSVPPKARNPLGIASAKPGTASKDAGAVDEEQFRDAFADTIRVPFSSGGELESELTKINTILSNPKEDWEKRVEQLKRLRGLIVAGASNYKEFQNTMRYVDLALQVAVKDLRSQVVREACVTLAFLAQNLEMRSERTAELTLPSLILLVPNSVKVMSTSGITGIRMILMYVHSTKLVPIITNEFMISKSKEIRRSCCEFIGLMLSKFPKTALERHLSIIQEALKKGMADADAEARALARQELDLAKQRQLEESMSRSTSQSSMKSGGQLSVSRTANPRTTPKTPNTDPLGVACALRIGQEQVDSANKIAEAKARSNSAIDMAAARRARAKAVLPTPPSRTIRPPTRHVAAPPMSRGRGQPSPGFTHSQPGSRSSSPSRFGILHKRTPAPASSSKDNSRDPSPCRSGASKIRSGYSFRHGSSYARKVNPDDSMQFGSRRPSQESSNHNPSDDESETSSLASEHSMNIHMRSRTHNNDVRDALPDITAQLSSGNWTTKRDGLLGFRRYLQNGSTTLSRGDLELICSIFTRMMNDPTTKVIGLFLDALHEFVDCCKLDLGFWLYTLMTKLLSKQGAELVPTVQNKIDKLYELVRSSFSTDHQFQHLVRFITDQTQTPNVRVKEAILNYLTALVQTNMQPSDLKNSSSSRLGLTKIINWTMDGRTPEIRKNSQRVLLALKELNPEEFQLIIDTLDEYSHEAAVKLVNGYSRRPSGLLDDTPRSPVTTPKSSMSKPPSGSRRLSEQRNGSQVASPSQTSSGNEENLNPDNVFSGLRQTSREIQKFGSPLNGSPQNGPALDRRRYPPSEPPAVSGSIDLFHAFDDYSVSPLHAGVEEQRVYLSTLAERIGRTPKEKQYMVIRHLHEYLPLITEEVWAEHFLTVLPVLYEHFQSSHGELTAWSLGCFAQLLKLQPTRMRQYPELTIVNILEVQKGASKLVIKAAEDCAYLAARTFPCDITVKILVPIINNQPHPENAAAVRLFSFLAQQQRMENVVPVLPAIISSLVKAFAENEESNMRKECVYALIYTQLKVGEDLMAPYLRELPPSKVRLMDLYLKRLDTHEGAPSAHPGGAGDASQSNISADTAV